MWAMLAWLTREGTYLSDRLKLVIPIKILDAIESSTSLKSLISIVIDHHVEAIESIEQSLGIAHSYLRLGDIADDEFFDFGS
jgi:hypothetical protein